MAKRKPDPLTLSSADLVQMLRQEMTIMELETASDVNRATISRLDHGQPHELGESKYRALVKLAIERGLL